MTFKGRQTAMIADMKSGDVMYLEVKPQMVNNYANRMKIEGLKVQLVVVTEGVSEPKATSLTKISKI